MSSTGVTKKIMSKGPQTLSFSPSQLSVAGTAILNSGMASCSHRSQPLRFSYSLGSLSPDQSISTACSQSTAHDSLQVCSEAETYQWLLNAGVPVSAFDPVALSDRHSSTKVITSELVDCADEITSLFASASRAASPSHAATEASVPILQSFDIANTRVAATPCDSSQRDVALSVSDQSGDDQIPLPDLLLGDGSFHDIGNNNWALW
jgi:hypothetical protein